MDDNIKYVEIRFAKFCDKLSNEIRKSGQKIISETKINIERLNVDAKINDIIK